MPLGIKMNEYAPKELCARLEKMGCKSNSGYRYDVEDRLGNTYIYGEGVVEAFEQNDFTGATEQARENSRIVFDPENFMRCKECGYEGADWSHRCKGENTRIVSVLWHRRHSMIENTDGKWFDYLERKMNKVAE